MPIYIISEIIISTIEREREREREGSGCCVASLKKNLPCTFFFLYVIDK